MLCFFKSKFILITLIILYSIPIKFLYAKSKIINSWDKINYKISDISPHSNEQVIVINKKNQIRLIDTYSKKIRRFPGQFKKIFYDGKNIFAISNESKFYKLKKRIWKKLKISNKLNFENVTIFKNVIYGVKDGKVLSFNTIGKTLNNKYIKTLNNVNNIRFIDDQNFLTHTKNGELNFYYKNKILETKIGVKKILFTNENFIVVSKENKGVYFLSTQNLKQNFKKIKFNKNFNKIIISKSGKIWGSDGKIIYVSSFTVDDLFLNESHRKLKKEKTFSSKLTATKLFSGRDGIFNIDEYGSLNYWSFKTNKFIPMYLKPLEISNPKKNILWVINSLGRIFYYNGKKWKQINGLAQSISSRKDLTLIVDENKTIKQFNTAKKKFLKTNVRAEKVFVKDNNNFWIMEKSKLKNCYFTGRTISLKFLVCKKLRGNYQNLKISFDGNIFAITNKNSLKIFDGDDFINYQIGPKSVNDIVGYKNNLLWFVDQNNNISKNLNKSFKYKTSSHFERVKFNENDITGDGDVLLYGKKVKKNKYKSSPSSSNGGFTYKKNMKRNIINNNVSFIDISFGRDGRLWAVSNINDVFQYKDKTKSFKKYTKTNFLTRDQQYFGLPNGIDVKRITSDNAGKIWVVKKDSKSVYFQDKLKGKYIERKLKGNAQNIKDLTIDASNNIYIAAGEIYKWDNTTKSFKSYIKKNGPFLRVSSGPTGTLWVINNKGKVFELLGGKLLKRPNKGNFIANDVEISMNGEVYITTEVKKTTTTTREVIPINSGRRGPPRTRVVITNTTSIDKCDLYKYHPKKGNIEKVFNEQNVYAEIITISREGSPWFTSADCDNKNVYYGASK